MANPTHGWLVGGWLVGWLVVGWLVGWLVVAGWLVVLGLSQRFFSNFRQIDVYIHHACDLWGRMLPGLDVVLAVCNNMEVRRAVARRDAKGPSPISLGTDRGRARTPGAPPVQRRAACERTTLLRLLLD